jgi:hypothetical protein
MMMYESRIRHLEITHETLNKKIDALEKTGVFTDPHLAEMKKQKLQVRDQLSDLRRRQWEHDHETVDMDDGR